MLVNNDFDNVIYCGDMNADFTRHSGHVSTVENHLNENNDSSIVLSNLFCSRKVSSLIFRLKLNALKTKFIKNIQCICGSSIGVKHILIHCQQIRPFLPRSFTSLKFSDDNLHNAVKNLQIIRPVAENLLQCPISHYL